MSAKKVLITDYVWPSVEPEKKVLAKYGIELIVAPDGNEDTLVDLAKEVDGILTCFAKVTHNVVKSAQNCKVIGRFGVGVDNIDVGEATKQGIVVTYVPDYCVDEVSDHVIGLLLAWNRKIVLHNNDTKLSGWGNAGLGMRIMRLRGKKLGIVGFGRIGRMVAKKAQAFGLEVLSFDPMIESDFMNQLEVKKVELDDLLTESHFVTLHSPLIPATANMLGNEQFRMMRDDAFLINCARGGLIDEDALHEALNSQTIAGAGVDVLVDIKPDTNHRLIKNENIIVTPHTAFFSQEAVLELEQRAAGQVGDVLIGKIPENIVNVELLKANNLRADIKQ